MLDEVGRWLFDPSGLTPHGFCLLWEPGLLWLHGLSDIGIGLAYFTIPLALAVFVRRRRDLVFRPVFWLFAAFILLCGAGHWLDVVTLWVPAYGVQGVVKAATAIVSMITAVALWRMLPQALALPSPGQLRAANAALSDSEGRYRASFEQSPVPLLMLEGRGIISAASNSWLALLGYTPGDVLGRPIAEFTAAGTQAWTEADVAILTAKGEIRDMERSMVRADGDVIDTLVSARLESRGSQILVVAAVIDITARRRAEAALSASEARLRQAQKMEAVGQLTGGIAHDFNNMLQSIASSLELMEARIEQRRPLEAARHIGVARQSVARAAGLTHRMLAFARRQALNPRAVDTAGLVRGMAELIRRTVGPGIGLVLRLRDDRWAALCDANQLESALLNLAINARDAMPDGSTLSIATANRHLTRADLSDQEGADPGDYIELAVADTGIGMTQDVIARAFEPFFTTKPIGQGTGLGLSQIYGFARQSGGFVRLDSKPGDGATFRLYLPRARLASAMPAHPPDEAAAPMADRDAGIMPDSAGAGVGTVLVVEDEPSVRAQIAEALRECGCVVLEAGDGPSGLLLVKATGRLDMLVTDVGLPGLNGRQLADAARESRPGLPVLLITGYAGTALEDMALSPGLEVIAKPFALGSLAARVCALLEASLVR